MSRGDWQIIKDELTKYEFWESLLDANTYKELAKPCIKKGIITGIGCCGLMAAHRSRSTKSFRSVFNASFLTFSFVAIFSSYACESEQRMKKSLIQEAFRKQNVKYKEKLD